jgi:hypothetical protein
MARCGHNGFRAIRSQYDRRRRILVFHWTCEDCGTRLSEAYRASYTPRFDPRGNDRYVAAAR